MNRKTGAAVVRKMLFFAYLAVLTFLLLVDDPEDLIATPPLPLEHLAHYLCFLLLAVLAMAAGWPVPIWGIFALLALYATSTELLQGAVTWRSCEWGDWFQDLAGIATGLGGWVIVRAVFHRAATRPQREGSEA